jgi:hypothetical protein
MHAHVIVSFGLHPRVLPARCSSAIATGRTFLFHAQVRKFRGEIRLVWLSSSVARQTKTAQPRRPPITNYLLRPNLGRDSLAFVDSTSATPPYLSDREKGEKWEEGTLDSLRSSVLPWVS